MNQILTLNRPVGPVKIVPIIRHANIIQSIPKAPKKIKPDNTPLWIKKGWIPGRNQYNGYYRTQYGAYRGQIVRRGDIFQVYIYNPPVNPLKKHEKWVCFQKRKGGKYIIHLRHNPKDRDPGSIIDYVERLIIESHERR